MTSKSIENLKLQAGEKAVDDYVRSGMVVGLGTGTTSQYALQRVATKLRSGELKDVVCIATSERTRVQAELAGIPLVSLASHSHVDVAIDGADEVDDRLNLVKGRGGALLREKLIEGQAEKLIVVVDERKIVKRLGEGGGALPVEVISFEWEFNLNRLLELESLKGCTGELWMKDGKPYETDNGNFVVNLYFGKDGIKDLELADREMAGLVGVVGHGLFLGMCSTVIVGSSDGVYVKEGGSQ